MGRLIPAHVAERAATRYTPNEEGCWISTYSVASHGYAQIGWNDGQGGRFGTTAHRAAWVHHTGQQPIDTIDHRCHVKACVNPAHLRELSNAENARRNGPDRDFPIGQSCAAGHDESDRVPRTSRRKNGSEHMTTICLPCTRASQAKYRAKQKAAS